MRYISELFVNDLDKATFLRGAAVMKISDNKLDDAENEFLSNINAVLKASENLVCVAKEYVGNHTQEESIASVVFSNKEQVIAFVLAAGHLAYADGEFAPGEQKVLLAIAKLNNLTDVEIEILLKEIQREYDFCMKREAIIKKLLGK